MESETSQTDDNNELRQKLTIVKATYENKIRDYKKSNDDQKRLVEENKKRLIAIENENSRLKDENKQLKDEIERALFECAQQEKLQEQERESRISLETAKFQELAQAKGNYIMSSLRQQHHNQIQKLENELQECRNSEYQLQHKCRLSELEKDSYMKRCESLEKDVEQWQNLAKSAIEEKLQTATIDLDRYQQSSQSYERAYKDQIIVAQKANSDKDEANQYHREQLRLLNTELENAQRLIQINEKREEEHQKLMTETKGVVDDLNNTLLETKAKFEEKQNLHDEIQRLKEENRQLSDISAIADTTPVGAVNLALQKKGKSIVQLYSEYSKLQERIIAEEKKNMELLQLLNTFNHEIEYDRIVNEHRQMSEQLLQRDKEIENTKALLKNSRSENQELNDRIIELQNEKELCVKHNTSLLEELDKLRKEGSTSVELNVNGEPVKYDDLSSLYSRTLHLESEKTIMIRKMQSYQNMISELEVQISLKNTENKNAVGEVTRLQQRLKQCQTQIETLERERDLELRKRRSMSIELTPIKGAHQMNVSSASFLPEYQPENTDLKNRLDIATDEIKNYEEKLRKANQELAVFRHEKIQLSYDKQHLEERYKILDSHFNMKNDESKSNKDLLRQVQKINEQLEKQAKQADNERVILSHELKTLKNEYQTRKDEWEQLQRDFNKEMDGLMTDKQKAETEAQGTQRLLEEKGRLETELSETQDKLLAIQVKHDKLNEQHEELSEKYYSILTKSAEDKSKFIEENTTLQQKIHVIESEQDKLNATIESLNKEIQEYKDKVHLLETQGQGPAIVQLQRDLDTLKKEHEELQKYSESYKDLAESRGKSLEENEGLYLELKTAADQEINEKNVTIAALQEELQKIKDELTSKEDNLNKQLKELSDALDQLSISQQQLNELMSSSAARDQQHSEETKRREILLEESQQNYNRELAAHAAAVKSLNDLQLQHKELQEEFDQLKEISKQAESSWNNARTRLEKELADSQQTCNDLGNDNKVLRNYFNNMTTDKASQYHVISLLRSDQQKVEAEKEYYAKQSERYKAQLEQTQKNYDETQALLLKERAEKSSPDKQLRNELLEAQKLSKILDESNQTLRNEKENLDKKMSELESSLKESEEKNGSLEAEIRNLKVDVSTSKQEITLLKDDNNKWKDRFQTVLKKYGTEVESLTQDLNKAKSAYENTIKTTKAQYENLKAQAIKLKNEKDGIKTKAEQLEKESVQLKQENTNSKQEITKLKELNKKIHMHMQGIQRRAGELKKENEETKKQIEELKSQAEEFKKQTDEKTKQFEEDRAEFLRVKAQESIYTSRLKRMEAENSDLKQKVQSLSESSSKAESANQPTAETTTKDTVALAEDFLQSLTALPIAPTSPSMSVTPNPPATPTALIKLDLNTANASPKSPLQATQELPIDKQDDVSQSPSVSPSVQPANIQSNNVQPATTSGVDSPNTTTSVLVKPSGNNNNTGQMQNVPREKPPVKIQRHRGPTVLPGSPRVDPVQIASPTPTTEEQSSTQPQTVPDTEKVAQTSEIPETDVAVQPVVQQASTEIVSLRPAESEPQTSEVAEEASSTETLTGHKRSRNEVEEEQLSTTATQAEDVNTTTIPSNVADEGNEGENVNTVIPVIIEDVDENPATKKMKLEE
ncbi:16741_t:CDS:10 [Funneliformis mosseae]|uniref:16741_t:CDS:1 n=1 Tax=Funneliformis mosseae TaxID=27381 RepID=A0A9N8Z709_FUNMO|nr:16741_t:CDS:10 [Funneliformis mosseae]